MNVEMARIGNRVLLGYEDEVVSEKYKSQVDFTTNKIGGKPCVHHDHYMTSGRLRLVETRMVHHAASKRQQKHDWPGDAPTAVNCKLCGLNVPLILQIYAPLENSQYHRTLYIFACINPNCWNQNGSWICLRSQILADMDSGENWTTKTTGADNMSTPMSTDWCSGSDNWGDDDEENGNLVDLTGRRSSGVTEEALSNRSSGGSQSTDQELATVFSSVALSDSNANGRQHNEGAAGIAAASAVIEADEGEVVSIDTPTLPKINLLALLEGAAPLPQVPISDLKFMASFISVVEEELKSTISPTSVDHVRDMLKEYQSLTGSTTGGEEDVLPNIGNGVGGNDPENYEKSLPAHGDKLFHQFLVRIHANPGHLFRYGGRPLFLYPVQRHELPRACSHCGGEVVFEAQVLPTLIPKLHLDDSSGNSSYHLEFGSVFLYTCQASCWRDRDTCREEPLLVQMEKI